MAIVRAVKSGNWSDPTVWNTGALPTSADDVYSNTFSVTIDISPTVLSISNLATTGVTAGGSFGLSTNGITLTCTGAGIVGNSLTSSLYISVPVGQTVNIIGNVLGSGAISHGGLGTVNLIGNVTGSSSGQGTCITVSGNGIFNVTGNIIGGSSSNSAAIGCNNSSPTINITGSVTGGTIATHAGVSLFGFGNTGILNITGTCTSASGAAIATNTTTSSTFIANITGALIPANEVPAFSNTTSTAATLILSGPFLVSANGTHALRSNTNKWFWANSNVTPTYYQIRTANLATIRPLYTADSVGGNPATSNVRSGTVYGPAGELTGTCAVPPAGSVALGVPVDNTTGTAVLTQANFQAALTAQGLTSARAANLDNLDTAVSTRLPTASYLAPLTEATTRSALGLASANLDTQLSPLPNLDTTVSSRLASASYQAPLDATGTRTAIGLASANLDTQFSNIPANVRTNLTTELGRIDTTVSSRLAAASYQAPLDASGTRAAIGLASANLDTQLDSLPTAAENAQAVRTELTTELGRIDVATSTRLASAGYTTPPTPEQNAQAVRTELTTELGRIDTTVSSRLATTGYTTPPTVGDIATAVWNAATSALSNLGSIGKLLVDNINASISSRLASASYQAPLDAAGTRTAIGLASANLDTQLAPLPNLDTTVSSRLASASYQAPLDASGTRAAIGLATANLDTQFTNIPANVRTNLTTELGRIDATVSSRSTFDPALDVVAHVTLVDTTTDLTNPPVVPTPEQIATAVRTELSPELDLIDVATSTRLASVDYTTPPTPEQNAGAVRTELATELGRIDTTVSSRLASVDYTTPPTALENAQAVEVQLSLPLGNMDVAVSSRSTFDPALDTVAHVTLVDTTTDLTNPPVVPTPEQIATAVRTELSPELDLIDVATSTRLAAADYQQPPTPEQNAEAVRTELAPELDRLSNCATVDTTGQQIQNALSI